MLLRDLEFLKKKKKVLMFLKPPSLSPSEKVLKMWNVVGNYSECNKNVHVKKKNLTHSFLGWNDVPGLDPAQQCSLAFL